MPISLLRYKGKIYNYAAKFGGDLFFHLPDCAIKQKHGIFNTPPPRNLAGGAALG